MYFCEFSEIFKSSVFIENLWETAFAWHLIWLAYCKLQGSFIYICDTRPLQNTPFGFAAEDWLLTKTLYNSYFFNSLPSWAEDVNWMHVRRLEYIQDIL